MDEVGGEKREVEITTVSLIHYSLTFKYPGCLMAMVEGSIIAQSTSLVGKWEWCMFGFSAHQSDEVE